MVSRREPERTCVGCRGKGSKRDLVRVVREADGSVGVDVRGSAPGRGAYVHRARSCMDTAVAKGALAKALRTGVDADGAARLRADLTREVVD